MADLWVPDAGRWRRGWAQLRPGWPSATINSFINGFDDLAEVAKKIYTVTKKPLLVLFD